MNQQAYFVDEHSIVRRIWGRSDTILVIFAGSAAEFALNRAVDWLYFTGRLPADPIGRLFSTVTYARRIVFSPVDEAHQTIDAMRQIHQAVEEKRGAVIPDWAYRDVLFMLIYYSIAAFELLERPLSEEEKEEIYHVFFRLGSRMGLRELPPGYGAWLPVRAAHLREDLTKSPHTADLFRQYRRHLGLLHYWILIEVQKLVLPEPVRDLLKFNRIHWLLPLVPIYRLSRKVHLDWMVKGALLPAAYQRQIRALDVQGPSRRTTASPRRL